MITNSGPSQRGLAAALALVALLVAGPAAAQYDFPRIGLSASPTSYVDTMTAEIGHEFTLYACVFAHEPGQPLQQPLHQVSWVVHQACCGAYLDVQSVELNPLLEHTGSTPLAGMVSSVDGCLDESAILLATLTVRLDAPGPGQYLWAAGPYAFAQDCEGGNPIFMDMPVTITVPNNSTPTEVRDWGALKALYR